MITDLQQLLAQEKELKFEQFDNKYEDHQLVVDSIRQFIGTSCNIA